jgi:hypothetical protein
MAFIHSITIPSLTFRLVIRQTKSSKSIHSTAAVMQNRAWQSEPGCEPLDCDRYDYHKVTPYACGFSIATHEVYC